MTYRKTKHRLILVQLDERTVMKINNGGILLNFWKRRYPDMKILSKQR